MPDQPTVEETLVDRCLRLQAEATELRAQLARAEAARDEAVRMQEAASAEANRLEGELAMLRSDGRVVPIK